MSVTTISSREFNQDAGGAKKAAEGGPVVITDRGKPAHVLMTYATYLQITGRRASLADALAQKQEGDFAFDPPRVGDAIFRPAEFD